MGGGGGSLPLKAVPDARENKRGKRVSNSGVGAERADREKGVKMAKNGGGGGGEGIQIVMIRVQALGLYVERVGKLR